MLNCRQCVAFTWKAFRGRFLHQFLWISVTRDDKNTDPSPPSACMSTTVLSNGIIELECKEQYQGLMADAAQCYKKVNLQDLAPLDVSSSLSALEESPNSSSEGEECEATSFSAIEESSSQRKPVQTMATVLNVDSSQVSSQTHQKEQTVIQMETDEANGQERGAASSSDEESSHGGNARSENPNLQTRGSVEFRGEERGGQSRYGAVHSVANETLLTSRALSSTSSSIRTSTYRDSTLDYLSRAQFHDPRSRDLKVSRGTSVPPSQCGLPSSVTAEMLALTSLEALLIETSRILH